MSRQYVDLYTAPGPAELSPRNKRQAEADGCGVEEQQFVPEPELLLAASRGAEPLCVMFRALFGGQAVKVHCCKNLRKQLTEQARRL